MIDFVIEFAPLIATTIIFLAALFSSVNTQNNGETRASSFFIQLVSFFLLVTEVSLLPFWFDVVIYSVLNGLLMLAWTVIFIINTKP